jgi:hypothetical protein
MDRILDDSSILWKHPGATDEQSESLVQEVLTEDRLRGVALVAVNPKPEHEPIFAYVVLAK